MCTLIAPRSFSHGTQKIIQYKKAAQEPAWLSLNLAQTLNGSGWFLAVNYVKFQPEKV